MINRVFWLGAIILLVPFFIACSNDDELANIPESTIQSQRKGTDSIVVLRTTLPAKGSECSTRSVDANGKTAWRIGEDILVRYVNSSSNIVSSKATVTEVNDGTATISVNLINPANGESSISFMYPYSYYSGAKDIYEDQTGTIADISSNYDLAEGNATLNVNNGVASIPGSVKMSNNVCVMKLGFTIPSNVTELHIHDKGKAKTYRVVPASPTNEFYVALLPSDNTNLTVTATTSTSSYVRNVSPVTLEKGKFYASSQLSLSEYLTGEWHLRYWQRGNIVLQFDGTEYIGFSGSRMVWAGRQDGSDEYRISYGEYNKNFVTTNINNSADVKNWEIIERTDARIVLKTEDAYRYFYKEEAQTPLHSETSDINTILTYASGFTESAQTPMGKHYENKRATTDGDKEWLLNPDNEPDPLTSAGLTQWIAQTVNLYPYIDPVPADVNQHAIGDCSACAVFASLAYLYPDFIKSIIQDNGNNTYTVKMFNAQGERIDVCVSNKILCDSRGTIGQVTGKNNAVTWATILEKAFMKWETRYAIDGVEGIGTEFLAPLFTGDGRSFAFTPNALHTSELKLFIEWALGEGFITIGGFTKGGLQCGTLTTVTAHAFTYLLSNNNNSIFAMRNPWGITSVDGVLEIPDNRTIVQTIDVRAVRPGIAAPYLRQEITPYIPPVFTSRSTDIGVSSRLLKNAN